MQIRTSDILGWLEPNKRNLIFFDLDSTIYDLSNRQIQILKEFAEHYADYDGYQQLSKDIIASDFGRMPFFPKDALKKYDISYPDDFEDFFYTFWAERFFSNEYIKYDDIEAGVNDFVQELVRRKQDIIYLTGRDEPRMGAGTRTKLRADKLYNDGEKLILKPEKSLIDKEFKLDMVRENMSHYDRVVFIDNEAANVNHIARNLSSVDCVFYDSVHSEAEMPDPNLYVLSRFD